MNTRLEDTLELLGNLVRINSYSLNLDGIAECRGLLTSELKKLNLDVRIEDAPEARRVIVACTRASITRPESSIVLLGHLDTVHPPTSRFNEFKIVGETAHGPGVLDMKSGLTVIIAALRELNQKGILQQIPIKVIINDDEEIGTCYSHEQVCRESNGAAACLVFEWGRAGDNIITKRKGVSTYDVNVEGKAAHSGNAHQQGASAIVQLAHVINKLHELTDYERGITVNVGIVSGGSSISTVAGNAKLSFDMRTVKKEDESALQNRIADIMKEIVVPGVTVSCIRTSYRPPLEETEGSRSLFSQYKKFGKQAGLIYEILPEVVGGGSDGNYVGAIGVPTIDGLGPFGEFAHSDKEYIKISSLSPKIMNLVHFLESYSA